MPKIGGPRLQPTLPIRLSRHCAQQGVKNRLKLNPLKIQLRNQLLVVEKTNKQDKDCLPAFTSSEISRAKSFRFVTA